MQMLHIVQPVGRKPDTENSKPFTDQNIKHNQSRTGHQLSEEYLQLDPSREQSNPLNKGNISPMQCAHHPVATPPFLISQMKLASCVSLSFLPSPAAIFGGGVKPTREENNPAKPTKFIDSVKVNVYNLTARSSSVVSHFNVTEPHKCHKSSKASTRP